MITGSSNPTSQRRVSDLSHTPSLARFFSRSPHPLPPPLAPAPSLVSLKHTYTHKHTHTRQVLDVLSVLPGTKTITGTPQYMAPEVRVA